MGMGADFIDTHIKKLWDYLKVFVMPLLISKRRHLYEL